MKLLLAMTVTALLCAACAQGGPTQGAGSGSVTMYGTIDEGVAYQSK
jgi:hypothetical protein